MKKEVLLIVKNLKKSFNKNVILDNISFELSENEVLGILGFSGEGKSTLLNIICGLINYDKGSVEFNFPNKKKENIHNLIRGNIGYSTQEPSFYDEMTVYENIAYFGDLLNVEKETLSKRTNELLSVFKLKNVEGKFGKDLSVGMKKRLDLACALIHNPKILILDEPTANLDFSLREDFLKYVKKVNQSGVAIIYVSHFVEEIELISDKILLLNKGKGKVIDKSKDIKKKFLDFIGGDKK